MYPPLLPVFRLRVLHSKMAPKIQTRTEIRYKCAQCFLGATNLKKSAAIIIAIFWSLTHMRELLEGDPRRLGTLLLTEKQERNSVFPGTYGNSALIELLPTNPDLASFERGKNKSRVPPIAKGGAQPSNNAP